MPDRQYQGAQAVEIITPPFLLANRLGGWARKKLEQVNSSACFGMTRTDNSSPDKSAPGSSKDSADSDSSTSTTADAASFRRALSSSSESSETSSVSVRRGAS